MGSGLTLECAWRSVVRWGGVLDRSCHRHSHCTLRTVLSQSETESACVRRRAAPARHHSEKPVLLSVTVEVSPHGWAVPRRRWRCWSAHSCAAPRRPEPRWRCRCAVWRCAVRWRRSRWWREDARGTRRPSRLSALGLAQSGVRGPAASISRPLSPHSAPSLSAAPATPAAERPCSKSCWKGDASEGRPIGPDMPAARSCDASSAP